MVVALYTTHLEALGRFLKIYGQTNHNEGLAIEAAIQKVVQMHAPRSDAVRAAGDSAISKGEVCLSRYSDGQYYRCEVIDWMAQDNVLVHFIDYGNDEMISTKDMLSLKAHKGMSEADYLLNAVAQAKEYILAAYWNTHWTDQALAEIRSMVVNATVATEMFSSVRDFVFINISIVEHGIADLANYLIDRGIGQVIDLRSQREQLMLIVDGLQEKGDGPSAYMANVLSMHSKHEVMVSHVQDGPFLFYVQLKKENQSLEEMMRELQRLRLREFPTDILIGMACLVRHEMVVYRGLISQIGPTSVVVSLVDYGRRVVVSYASIFEMPGQYLKLKVFAIRSTIAGYRKLDRYNKEIKDRFREIVMGPEGCHITIKVTPLEGSSTMQYCEVFQGTDTVVYNELLRLQTKSFELGQNEPVPNGFEGPVKITWCHSPARLYVRLVRKEEEYQKLAVLLNDYYEGETRPALTEIRIGAICALKANKQWYRTEILDIKKADDGQKTLIVNFIDVGRDVEVGLTVMKRLNYDICQVPPMALECSLYQVNVENCPGTVAQFVRAINLDKYPNRVYTMRVSKRTLCKQMRFNTQLLSPPADLQ